MGNVVGSNLFNILLVLGATSVVRAVPVPGTHPFVDFGSATGAQDLIMMTLLTLLVFPLAATGRQRISRLEGILLGGLWIGYMIWALIR
jgi:cation:H+ antiporter